MVKSSNVKIDVGVMQRRIISAAGWRVKGIIWAKNVEGKHSTIYKPRSDIYDAVSYSNCFGQQLVSYLWRLLQVTVQAYSLKVVFFF